MLMASGVRFKCLQHSSLSTLSMVTRLDSTVPSDAELDEARRIVGDFNAKSRARGMAEMKSWLESSATPEERATLQALRGDQRDEYMRRFLVYQIRDKEARKQCVSSRTHGNKRVKCETMHQWCYEKFLAEIGRDRALAWNASGKFESIPDPFTGSEEPEMRTYFVPSHKEIFKETNRGSRSISAATDACEVDVQDMDVLQDIGPASSTMSRSNVSLNLMRTSATKR